MTLVNANTDIDWRGLVEDIELLARTGCYEKVNNFLSLGKVDKLRRRTAELTRSKGILADLGGGPGTSTRVLDLSTSDVANYVILLDPSIEMLSISNRRLSSDNIFRIAGRFERLPFRDRSISGVVAMFSFRDAVDYYEALDEIARVLDDKGKLAILDIYHHDNSIIHLLVKAYIFLMVPLAIIINRCPIKYLKTYKSFLKSIDRMMTAKELINELNKRFHDVEFIPYLPGAGIFYARKPKR